MGVRLQKWTRPAIAYGLAVLFVLSIVACKGDEAEGVQLGPTAVDVNFTVTSHVVTLSPTRATAERALLYSVYNIHRLQTSWSLG